MNRNEPKGRKAKAGPRKPRKEKPKGGAQQCPVELRKKAVGLGSESCLLLRRESRLWHGRGYSLWNKRYGMVTARQSRQGEEKHLLTDLCEV